MTSRVSCSVALPTWKREPRQVREEATVAWKRVVGPFRFVLLGGTVLLGVPDFTVGDLRLWVPFGPRTGEVLGVLDFTVGDLRLCVPFSRPTGGVRHV